jgi:DNA helicase IV
MQGGQADGTPDVPEQQKEEGRNTSLPYSTYNAQGGLPQDPGAGGESLTVTVRTSAFDLPTRLAAKADPALIARDEQQFAFIAETLGQSIEELSGRLDAERRQPGGSGEEALNRDLEIHRLTGRLRALRRFGLDLCLGRMVRRDDPEPVYIGRLSLTDRDGRRLLIDWRAPAAEPFFAATHAHPMGLASRRRYRWTGGRISDYWDEAFTASGREGNAALDDESAFLASLGSSRSPRMRDVLATIQADQDAIIRAGSRGGLVVDGGPGTGKTVVALHRAAYLLYSEPHLARAGGVLVVGPHQPYLAYVADVLPSLGEEGVQLCTLQDMVPEAVQAAIETDPQVAALKSSAELLRAVDTAVKLYEAPPATGMTIETPWSDIRLRAADWSEAFGAADAGTPHNESRDQVWEALLETLVDQFDEDEAPPHQLRRVLLQNEALTGAFAKAWPLLDPVGVVADLWSVPDYLRLCAPWLSGDQLRRLRRADARAWTVSDLPFLDAARRLIGDPGEPRRRRQRQAALAAEQEQRERVADEMIAADDSELLIMTMLRGQDVRNTLVDEAALPSADPDLLAGPFAHIVVDEAQELTDAEWQMLLHRCPSRSFTIVGDRAQARHGFPESWQERLERAGLGQIQVASLTLNYRTPREVMAEAEPVIRAVLPDANVPTSVRTDGHPVVHGAASELELIVEGWLAEHPEGIGCVIGDSAFRATSRVRSLTPVLAKGLEFDLVALVKPGEWGAGIEGAVDRYVAMTRSTQQLVILT